MANMDKVVNLKSKRTRSTEEVYPPEIVRLEEEVDSRMNALEQKAKSHGIDSITYEDYKKVDFLSFKLSILYKIHGYAPE